MTILLGTRKGLIALEGEGIHWSIVRKDFPGAPISYAWHDARSGTLWAAASHGHWGAKLYRLRKGEEEWTEVPAPAYPEGEEIRPGVGATLQYIWCMAGGGEDRPERILVGTIPGGLFISNDGGDSFQLNRSLWEHPSRTTQWFGGGYDEAGIHSILVDPENSDRIHIGISCAGVFETTDGGSSWIVRNKGMAASFLPDPNAEVGFDPHLLTASNTQPRTFWQQNHEGVYRSDDECLTWQRHDHGKGSHAYFGFAIAVDEKDPMTAWIVPADSDERRMAIDGKLVVSRTEDGGETWTALTAGLPQEDCYDLVYRHGLAYREGLLAFGTTTGNLFISNDRGDSWIQVAGFLPPIYSVQIVPDM